jgi:hypothetical protein
VKSTPMRGVKEFLKPHAYKQSEDHLGGGNAAEGLTACLLLNESASYCLQREVKPLGGAVAKASLNRASKLQVVDPKRDDLPMARVKAR